MYYSVKIGIEEYETQRVVSLCRVSSLEFGKFYSKRTPKNRLFMIAFNVVVLFVVQQRITKTSAGALGLSEIDLLRRRSSLDDEHIKSPATAL